MDTWKTSIASLPEILFAHTYSTANYDRFFIQTVPMVEITYIERGTVQKTYENGLSLTIPPDHIAVEPYRCPFRARSSEPHAHCTIAFRAPPKAHNDIELPFVLSDPEMKYYPFFSQAIFAWSENTAVGALKAKAYLLALIAELADDFRKRQQIRENHIPASSLYYVEKAKSLIALGDFSLSLTQIANQLNISEGHLSRIFKQIVGTTVTDFINRCCIEKMKNIIGSKNISLQSAARMVGIDDEHYASKLFKKYIGISYTDFLKRNVGK